MSASSTVGNRSVAPSFPVMGRGTASTGMMPASSQGTIPAATVGGGVPMRATSLPGGTSGPQFMRAASAPSAAPASGADILALLQRGAAAVAVANSGSGQVPTPTLHSMAATSTVGTVSSGGVTASAWMGGFPAGTPAALPTYPGDGSRPLSSIPTSLGPHDDASTALSPSTPSVEGYGLLGLLGVIRMTDRDLSTLAVGTDLTSLNLNLAASEPLLPSFAHPWGEVPVAKEPAFTLPASYKVPQPALKTGHFGKFDVGTLLYIFYSMPKDILQAHAAQELYNREWKYQKDMKLWFKREGTPTSPTYHYWDITTWEKKLYSGNVSTLLAGFLSEEEARVKVPAPSTST